MKVDGKPVRTVWPAWDGSVTVRSFVASSAEGQAATFPGRAA